MKLKFKIQQYWTDAVGNVVKVFNGQPNKGRICKKCNLLRI